ncbi:MAG TPA: IclR family transcriptional regulator [Ktedonobacteraceae bacterium]|nr:IclR family transcriptional regulator [Ktedonobacteraceae bacterium]
MTKDEASSYNVRMKERAIRNGEQKSDEGTPGSAVDVPAPMVERAFRLLDLLVDAEEGMALSDLARALKMSKGSLHGLLKTLEHCAVIEQREDRLYAIGPRIYNLAAYVWSTGLRRLAVPAMQRLAATIGETIFLGRVEQNIVRVIESCEAGSEFPFPHISVPRGTRIPLLAGISGRIVLASWPVERRQSWLHTHPLPRFTQHSITDTEQYLAIVEEVTQTGIAMEHEEYLPGVNAVGVPVIGPGNSLTVMLCALGFTSHFDDEAMHRAGQQLQAEAEIISRSLGAR